MGITGLRGSREAGPAVPLRYGRICRQRSIRDPCRSPSMARSGEKLHGATRGRMSIHQRQAGVLPPSETLLGRASGATPRCEAPWDM